MWLNARAIVTCRPSGVRAQAVHLLRELAQTIGTARHERIVFGQRLGRPRRTPSPSWESAPAPRSAARRRPSSRWWVPRTLMASVRGRVPPGHPDVRGARAVIHGSRAHLRDRAAERPPDRADRWPATSRRPATAQALSRRCRCHATTPVPRRSSRWLPAKPAAPVTRIAPGMASSGAPRSSRR